MNIVSRAILAVLVVGIFYSLSATAQEYPVGQDQVDEIAPASLKYDRNALLNSVVPNGTKRPAQLQKTAAPPASEFVDFMINAYTTESTTTNQLGYHWPTQTVTLLYRAGPDDVYDDDGRGELVLNTWNNAVTENDPSNWSGPSDVFNADLLNIRDERAARHPSIYLADNNGQPHVASVWSNIHYTFSSPNGFLGQIAYKSGPLGGGYSGDYIDQTEWLQFYPTRIKGDSQGNLYTIFQTIDPATDFLTGEFFMMKSTDNGMSWNYDYSNPILVDDNLPDRYQVFESTMDFDVSPDGSTIYVSFVGIFVDDGSFSFIDNRLGYVRSTDGGATWEDAVLHPYDTWLFPEGIEVDQLDGFFRPSIAVAVDGLNKPHFLTTAWSPETFLPIDSTLVGEVIVDAEDPSSPPEFLPLFRVVLSDIRRFRNPANATDAAQPQWSIWNEHEWAKTPDGMNLVGKWIDAANYWVENPEGGVARDSVHNIYFLTKDVNRHNEPAGQGWFTADAGRGWEYDFIDDTTFNAFHFGITPDTDQKFTKINPILHPDLEQRYLHAIYTIQGEGEFVTGQIYPDTDDLGTAELYLASTTAGLVGINDGELGEIPNGFVLNQNYPTPFNPTTTISFSLPEGGKVKLAVYNMLGEEVATIFDGNARPGPNTFTFNASSLESGNYVYRAQGLDWSVSKVMTLLK